MDKIKLCCLTTISQTMNWFLCESMRNLAKNGYEITLVSNMDEKFMKENSDFAKCINVPMCRGVNPINMLKSIRALKKLFKEHKFDAIYYTTPNASFYSAVAGKSAKIKHRIYNQCGIRYVTITGIKKKIFKFLEKLTCKFSTTVRSQSPKNMQFAINEKLCKKDKISVIGIGGTIGVDLKECDAFNKVEVRNNLRSKYGIPKDAFVYGYVGRINTDKGINELVLAFDNLSRKINNVYLVLIGYEDKENPITEENMQIAKSNSRVVFTGAVPITEVYRHMSILDVLTHPTYREGFGKVLQEAMGMSLAIVTTNVPGPSEVVEENVSGLLVSPKNANELENAMKLLFEDNKLKESLALNGRKRAETYFDRPIMLSNILEDMNKLFR